jgi:hypothetical protein
VTLARRSFITGLISLVAAPAIIRAGSLMPVKVMLAEPEYEYIVVSSSQWTDLLKAQRSINLRRSIALQIINSRGLQPYSG